MIRNIFSLRLAKSDVVKDLIVVTTDRPFLPFPDFLRGTRCFPRTKNFVLQWKKNRLKCFKKEATCVVLCTLCVTTTFTCSEIYATSSSIVGTFDSVWKHDSVYNIQWYELNYDSARHIISYSNWSFWIRKCKHLIGLESISE